MKIESAKFRQLLPTHMRVMPDGYQMTDEFRVFIWADGQYIGFDVSAGYNWETSVPKGLQWFAKRNESKHAAAALVHDLMYERRMNRKLADCCFREILIDSGVSRVRAYVMWGAVRIGGHAFYASDTSRFWRQVRRLFD
ncbi:MAG: DUF1353 domain-containing protein [Thalassolituus sp.]